MKDQINLTDEKFWESFWGKRKDIIYKVAHTNTYWEVFYKELTDKNFKSFIEIGGFPGHFSVFAKKYFNLQPSLIDIVFVPAIFNKLCECNKLKISDFEIFQGDIFEFQPKNNYDVVFSCGLIEHFKDLNKIIEQHVRICNEGGKIIIIIPNFRGLFGLAQLLWDRKTLKAHNLNSMKISVLHEALEKEQNVKHCKVFYYGESLTSVGNYEQLNKFQKSLHKVFTACARVFAKWIPVQRLYAHSIVIVAEKKS